MRRIIFSLIFFFLFVPSVFAQTNYIYIRYKGLPIGVAWDFVEAAISYQVRVKHLETGQYSNIDITPSLSYFYKPSKIGHYIFEVRVIGPNNTMSEWAVSTDPRYARVNNKPQGWIVKYEIAPPGKATITRPH